jgi:hypothetical protein
MGLWYIAVNTVVAVDTLVHRGWYTFAHLCFGLLFLRALVAISYLVQRPPLWSRERRIDSSRVWCFQQGGSNAAAWLIKVGPKRGRKITRNHPGLRIGCWRVRRCESVGIVMYLRSQNRAASGVQNRRPNERSKTRPKTALQIPETSIYRQIVIRKTSKKGVQIDLQNGRQKYGPKHVRDEGAQELL